MSGTPFDWLALEDKVVRLQADVFMLAQAMSNIIMSVDALQKRAVGTANALRDHTTTTPAEIVKTNPDTEVPTVNGVVKLQDIPLDASGWPTEDWALENCLCDVHTKRRAARAGGNNDEGIGQYL